jgi:hypothetical protein
MADIRQASLIAFERRESQCGVLQKRRFVPPQTRAALYHLRLRR